MANIDNTAQSLSKCSFSTLIGTKPVRIPKIQRDYAQGRNNQLAKDIREKFVHDLVSALQEGTDIELDFVYGSDRKGAFEPLDGQQRLTTLFLLHWLCGVPLYDKEKGLAKLSYETRSTSTDFCLELVKDSPDKFIEEITKSEEVRDDEEKRAQTRLSDLSKLDPEERPEDYAKQLEIAKEDLSKAKAAKGKTLSGLIVSRDWFNYLWQYDPTIQSMLVMLDTFIEEFKKQCQPKDTNNPSPTTLAANISDCKENLDKITFSNLDLGFFGLSDELFIKMNARGKQLSTFDILKSSLEEELQIQKSEGHCDTIIEEKWRSLVDGKWIDWFWNMNAAGKVGAITESEKDYKDRLGFARAAEEHLKCLILRSIALRFVIKDNLNDQLFDVCYGDNLSSLDRLMTIYNDSLKDFRPKGTIPDSYKEIDFPTLIGDINCLFYQDSHEVYHDIFSLIGHNYNINSEERHLSYLDIFISPKCPNDAKLVYYALLHFALAHPIILENGSPSASWKEDFCEWAHFIRNLYMYENNTTRIDTPDRFREGLKGVDQLISRLADYYKTEGNHSVLDFIKRIEANTFVGVDNQSLSEEVKKADLKTDSADWRGAIEKAEAHSYIWGQVRSLLNWSKGNIVDFIDYTKRLTTFLDYQDKKLLYAGILCVDPTYGFSNRKLYLFNKERDLGFKRYLRDNAVQEGTLYAPALKKFLDEWRTTAPETPIEQFIELLRKKALNAGFSYVNCIIELPEILDDAWYKIIENNSDGHYVIAQRKTASSHCFDIALKYLQRRYSTEENKTNIKGDIIFFHSVSESYQNAIQIPYKNDRLLVKEESNGEYSLSVNGQPERVFGNETNMLGYMLRTYPAL